MNIISLSGDSLENFIHVASYRIRDALLAKTIALCNGIVQLLLWILIEFLLKEIVS